MLTYHCLTNSRFFADYYRPVMDLPGMQHLADDAAVLSAGCLVVHIPSVLATNDLPALQKLRKVVPRRQVWVAESLESAIHYPAMNDPDFMALFDLEASYRQTADVWTPYLPRDFAGNGWQMMPGPRRKLCCAFISSSWDHSDRRAYVRELMQCLAVDSYGRFMRNRKLWFDRGMTTKLKLLRRYHYTLAFENSISTDYVTEKFFQPLQTGTIPVYLGAPNIEEFAPGDNCYINAADFPSPRDLAQYLLEVDPAQFHAWRNKPLRPSFMAKLARLTPHWPEQLVAAIGQKIIERG